MYSIFYLSEALKLCKDLFLLFPVFTYLLHPNYKASILLYSEDSEDCGPGYVYLYQSEFLLLITPEV